MNFQIPAFATAVTLLLTTSACLEPEQDLSCEEARALLAECEADIHAPECTDDSPAALRLSAGDCPSAGGKTDVIGNRSAGEDCWYDWQCSSNKELICRPETDYNVLPENYPWECQKLGVEWGPSKVSPGLYCGDYCVEDDDCAEEFRCVFRDHDATGRCLQPGHKFPHNYPLNACPDLRKDY